MKKFVSFILSIIILAAIGTSALMFTGRYQIEQALVWSFVISAIACIASVIMGRRKK